MKLHENKTLFNQAVWFTVQELGILDIYVEKDYWVTFSLKIIFSSKQQIIQSSKEEQHYQNATEL